MAQSMDPTVIYNRANSLVKPGIVSFLTILFSTFMKKIRKIGDYFVQYVSAKVRQKSDKIDEISAW